MLMQLVQLSNSLLIGMYQYNKMFSLASMQHPKGLTRLVCWTVGACSEPLKDPFIVISYP